MDHRYIDENGVAERYLEHALPTDEHDAFEFHLVACEECADRLLLAQIFLEHRPQKPPGLDPKLDPELEKDAALALMPLRARFVAWLKPWQLLLLAILAAAALLAIPTTYFFLELARVNRAH
jgi:hypothetical protein